jgi:hypothetical protein
MRRIPYERLRRVWMNRRFTTDEVAAILLLTEPELRRLAALHRLPKRHFVARFHDVANDEPDAAELAAQRERAEECRRWHLEERMLESAETTRSKASNWRRGLHVPGGERHAS